MAEDKGFKRLSVNVNEATIEKLRLYAEDANFVTTSGVTAGLGSISALLRAIGDGRFVVVPVAKVEDVQAKVRRPKLASED